ncbi:hypothetical protein [Streptomyces rubiginosohelvolus]|uniref:Acetyltransferase n=1 Tax=Streptomyces rubiginosohelvolus TaxID=67362 RepID=A0ABW6F0X6_9ACTN
MTHTSPSSTEPSLDPLLKSPPALSFRRAGESDLTELVRLRDDAARWQIERGIDQWKPGELGPEHFGARLRAGEVWIATAGRVPGPGSCGGTTSRPGASSRRWRAMSTG